MHQQSMVPDHGTQYEEKSIQPSRRNAQGWTDRLMDTLDRLTDRIFSYIP